MKSLVLNVLVFAGSLTFYNCAGPQQKSEAPVSVNKELTQQELIARGKYLTTIGGCSDCHSPKTMTAMGPGPDTTRLLSGHPQNEKLSKIISTPDWILFNNGATAFVGPWGVSYAANLTPDDTGIGSWSFEQFTTAIRKGKYKGLEGSRPLLPPMPWQMYKSMTDEDLKAVFTYLKSLPPINNLVPAPIPPNNLMSLAK
jgi:hypothetical protein